MAVPKLRFKGHNSEWKKVKLAEITTRIGDGLHSTPEYDEKGSIYFANGSNIKGSTLAFDEKTKKISEEEFSKYNSLLNENSILVSLNGATWGRFGFYHGEKILLGKSLGYINISNSQASKPFIYYHLQLKKIRKFFESEITGSTIKNLSLQTLRNTEVSIPTLEEQNKIANFLMTLDEKIKLHQEKIDLLTEQKKGFMKKIFSQELRFKDKMGQVFPQWTNILLEEVLSKSNNDKVPVNEIDPNKLLTVKLHRQGVKVNTNNATLKIGSTVYYKRQAGDFIYGKQNFFNGAFGIIPTKLDGYLSSGDVPTLEVNKKKVNPTFLVEYFGREDFYKKCENLASGTGSKRIHETTILSIDMDLPNIEEQNLIVNFANKFEYKISQEKIKLNTLETQKQAFMQQMYI